MDPNTNLLETKYQIPQIPAQMVPRTHLFESLDAALQPYMRATLISAPAGYGKTTLVNAWVQDRPCQTAWLSLDEQDDDPIRFTRYLLASLVRAIPDLSLPENAAGPFSAGEFQETTLIPLLNQLGQRTQPMMIILDDYHWIQNPTVHQVIIYLLEHLPSLAHIVILTRADPALPLAQLRARGQLIELRMEDLRFQLQETEIFLKWFVGPQIRPDEVDVLLQRTEGWIAGLQMAALSLQSSEDFSQNIESFGGDQRYIMDYLLDEVLSRQLPQIQDFLINTSILSRLCGPLCDTLLAEHGAEQTPSDEVLLELEHANLFIIPLDRTQEWYRYHRLFADLLQARLQRRGPDHIQNLHRRASQWFEEQDLMEDAIQYALIGEDFERAADLLERTAQGLLMRSETSTLLRWLQRLPERTISNRPKLSVYQGWALLFMGAPLAVVEARLLNGDAESEPAGSSEVLRAYVALSQGKLESGLELAEHALEILPQEEIFLRDFAVFCAAGGRIASGDEEGGQRLLQQSIKTSMGSRNPSSVVICLTELAEMRMKQMQLDKSEELYQRALTATLDPEGKRLPIGGRAMIGLGNIALERFELDLAKVMLIEGAELAGRWNLLSRIEGYLSLAVLYHARGEWKELEATFEALHDLTRRFDATDADDWIVDLVESRLNVHRGDLNAVRLWVTQRGLDKAPYQLPAVYTEDFITYRMYKYELPTLIRLWIAESRYDDAHEAIIQLIDLSSEAGRPFLVLEAEILRAKLNHVQGEIDLAVTALQRALEMAYPSRAMRLFLTEGETILELLRTHRSDCGSPMVLEFVDSMLNKAKVDQQGRSLPDKSGPETLSPRELEVLQLLPSELTAEELAGELIISVNTVRTHMKSIYSKLDVHKRHLAVDRARLLDLI